MKGKKQKKESILSKLLNYGGKYKRLTYLGMILSGVSAVVVLFTIIFVWSTVKDSLLVYPDINFTDLAPKAFLALSCALGGALIYFASLMCTHVAAFRVAKNLRTEGIKHLMKLPLGYFDSKGSGKLRRTLSENISETENYLAHQIPDMVGAIVTPIAVIILLFMFDWRLGLVSFLGIITVFIPMIVMFGVSKDHMEKYMKSLDEMNNEAVEYVRGIPVIKTFGSSIFSFKKFHKKINEYKIQVTGMSKTYQIPMIIFQTMIACLIFVIVYAGIIMIPSAENILILVTDLIFYILFLPTCSSMILKTMWISEGGTKAELAYNAVSEIINAKPLFYPEKTKTPIDFNIEVNNVTFKYPNARFNAVENINFLVKQGETIAFVGESGSGKSTIVSLIARFFDADKGTIKIGGVDIRDIKEEDMMKNISFVFQNTQLYKGTILDNLKEGKVNATKEEIIDALKKARCEEFINKMPDGINSKIGTGGIFLSGGEVQRIAIARAILKNSPIILLDEATAFTDPENEHEIQLALGALAKDKTVILIAHRLSTVKDADCIYVMSNGKIIEKGTNDELLNLKGQYANMYEEYNKAFDWKKINSNIKGALK